MTTLSAPPRRASVAWVSYLAMALVVLLST